MRVRENYHYYYRPTSARAPFIELLSIYARAHVCVRYVEVYDEVGVGNDRMRELKWNNVAIVMDGNFTWQRRTITDVQYAFYTVLERQNNHYTSNITYTRFIYGALRASGILAEQPIIKCAVADVFEILGGRADLIIPKCNSLQVNGGKYSRGP